MSELTTLLAAEEAVLAAAARSENLPPDLRALRAQASARVVALRAEVARTKETAAAPPAAGGPALDVALERAIGVAHTAAQVLEDQQTLRVVARVMAGDGQSLALLRQSMNRSPVPSALETGKAP